MFNNLNTQKLCIYFLAYILLKTKNYIIELEKLNYVKGKKLNFFEENYFQKEKLYISIDFGNYKCRYAYNFGGNKNAIYEGKMQSIPSVIILNKSSYTAKNYGWKSIHSIENYNENEKNQIIFLNNLKLNLYNKKIGQKLDDKEIISIEYTKSKGIIEFLRSFSDDALEEINSFKKNEYEKYNKSEVNWIISTPKIWDDYSKLNLIKFGKEAGMNNIDLVLEPEAATLSFFYDKFIDIKYKQEGQYFMMIDLGEYICDITINEIIDNLGTVKQLSLPLGDTFGSMNINNDLMDIIKLVLGNDTIEEAKNKQFEEYLQTLEDIEKIKKKFTGAETENFEIYAKFKRNITHSFWKKVYKFFVSLFKKDNKDSFNYHNYTIKFDNYKVYIPGLLIKEVIKNRVNQIIKYVTRVIDAYKIYNINHIILTGGYSNSKILINEFRKTFNNIHISVLVNQENSISKGALIYTFNKNKIVSRKSQNSYGIETYRIIDDNETCHNIKKIKNIKYCQKIEHLIKRGDTIFYDSSIQKIINPYLENQDEININFYKTQNKDFNDFDYFGTLKIRLNEYINNKNGIKLKILIDLNKYFNINAYDLFKNKKLNSSFHPKN